MDHTAKDGHFVISVTKEESVYLEELNVSHKSLALNKKGLQTIESEIALLTAAKESAIKDMESYMDLAREQLERRRDDLLHDILDRFNDQRNTLLDKQKELQEATETINENVAEAKTITNTGHLNKLKPICETLKELNGKVQYISSNLNLGENYLAFDSNKGLEQLIDISSQLGQTYFKGSLPSTVAFGSAGTTAGDEVSLTVEICNHRGEKLPISSEPGSFSVQLTDPTGNEVQTVLSTFGLECTLTFTPQMSGLHKVSGIFLGQQLTSEQTHIPVSSNNPVSTFDHLDKPVPLQTASQDIHAAGTNASVVHVIAPISPSPSPVHEQTSPTSRLPAPGTVRLQERLQVSDGSTCQVTRARLYALQQQGKVRLKSVITPCGRVRLQHIQVMTKMSSSASKEEQLQQIHDLFGTVGQPPGGFPTP